MLFTEEDLGLVSSKLHLNIWFDSKIITRVIKLWFWRKNYIADI